jgi:Uma2 family endonuclease
MASLPKTHLVTYEEWLEMPESEGREEVVNGEIIPMPPAKDRHMHVLEQLLWAFMHQLDKAQHKVCVGAYGLVIRTAPLTSRIPDLAIFDRATLVVKDGYYHSPPQLAIEILSPSETRRRTEAKLRDYESIGVPEIWIFSPEGATVEVLYLENDRLVTARVLVDGILRPRALPSVAIDVESIWPD